MPIENHASPLPSQRHLFTLEEGVTYLNIAYMSPLLKTALEAGEEGLHLKAKPWNMGPDMFFKDCEKLRPLVGNLMGSDGEHIAIVPSASYGLATASLNLEPHVAAGDEILVLDKQFPSNYYIWLALAERKGATIRTVATPLDGNWTDAVIAHLNSKTRIIAIPNCHWTDGTWVDLARIRKEIGTGDDAPYLVLDLTQSFTALPFDVKDVQPDFVACATYKWAFCPYGMGVLYASDRFCNGQPLEMNWVNRSASEDQRRLVEYCNTYQPGARRFDSGERSNPIQLPMAIAAFEQLSEWGVDRVHATIRELTDHLATRAEEIGLQVAPREHRAGHMIGLLTETPWSEELPQTLKDAHIHVSFRGNGIRVSPHVYNTKEDVDRLVDFLAKHR